MLYQCVLPNTRGLWKEEGAQDLVEFLHLSHTLDNMVGKEETHF